MRDDNGLPDVGMIIFYAFIVVCAATVINWLQFLGVF